VELQEQAPICIEQTKGDSKWVAGWLPREFCNTIIYPSPGHWWNNHSYTGTKPADWALPGYLWACEYHGWPYLSGH
jgi:hypothetical protein